MKTIKLPPLPSPFGIVDPDGTEGMTQYTTKDLQDYAKAYARTAIESDRKTYSKQLAAYKRLTESLEKRLTLLQAQHDELKKGNNPKMLASERAANAIMTAELEADRQKNNALIRYMPEVIAALKATGCNESLVADIEKAMCGEYDRKERGGPAAWIHKNGLALVLGPLNGSENLSDWTPLYTAPQPQARGEPVADCYSNDHGDTWQDCHDDIEFVHGLEVGDEYELQASVRAWSERFRVTKVPDEKNDDYEVEPVSIRAAPQPPQIPEGYALVPIEPTQEMKDAADFRSERYGHIATNKYKAMIKAAPLPTTIEQAK